MSFTYDGKYYESAMVLDGLTLRTLVEKHGIDSVITMYYGQGETFIAFGEEA